MAFFKVMQGTDFEFFAKKGNKKLAGEKVLKKEKDGIVLDGLAIEVQPNACTCRENIARSIQNKMRNLQEQGIEISGEYEADFSDVWKDIKEESKELGCEPDYDVYSGSINVKNLDGATISKRFAGGHIHIGGNQSDYEGGTKTMNDHKRLIPLLDIIVGIPSVLIDRQNNKARREQYGKAGSFRKKPYGVEYRVLSNFWIADVKLFYLFFGLSRTAVNILYNYHRGNKEGVATYNKIMERVNQQEVIQAINNNDFDLAKKIFESIEDILVKIDHTGDSTHSFPLHEKGMTAFKYLVINTPDTSDIINAWCKDSTNRGWDYFIANTTFDKEKINADFKALKLGENKVHIQHIKEKNEPAGTKCIILSMDTPSLNEYKAVYVSTETKTIDVDGVPSLYPVAFYNGNDLFEDCYVYSHDVKVVTATDEFKTVVIK